MQMTDPHSYMDLSQGKIRHIDLRIDINFPAQRLHILATYDLEKPVSGSLFLDSRDIQVERVFNHGGDIPWKIDEHDSIMGQRLHLQDLDNVSDFSVQLTTSSQASALQWMTPQQTAGGRTAFLYSQCYPVHARSLFPCQDSPSVRFTYQVEMHLPNPVTAVMAAENLGARDEKGERICTFRMPQPVPAYLFAFAAGNLVFREIGPRTGVYAEPELIESAAWEFAENEHKLAEAEKLLGPYLWDRYDVLIMPPSFPYGGMENPRLTFLSPSVISGDRSRTFVISHELAHAWTGNLITNATWEDFWLNEGWTTYAESRITEAIEGSDSAQLTLHEGRMLMLEDMERLGMDSQKTRLKYSLQGLDPDEVFSSIPYVKGYFFVAALEQAVGRLSFDQFMQKYIATYPFASLTTEEFISFLENELPAAANQVDIHEWLYQPGFPADAPALTSRLSDQVERQLLAYQQGVLPTPQDVSHWKRNQVNLFLRSLNQKIPVQDCRHLESVFGLQDSRDTGLLTAFYMLAIRSGYVEVMPKVEKFARSVGSFGSIIPVFRCLAENEWTQKEARALFEKNRQYHHPITVKRIEQILSESGL
jgi:leukotriene-A4 hydrolase